MNPKDQLKAWIAEQPELTEAAFARRVDYDRGNFHRLLNGPAWPSLELALRIETATGGKVPMSAWAQAKAAA